MLVDCYLFTPPVDSAPAKSSRLPPSSITRHHAFHRCHRRSRRVAVAPSIGVASPPSCPLPLLLCRPSPSSPSHCRRTVHRCCRRAVHCRCCLRIAIMPSVAIALLLRCILPSPSPLRRPLPLSPSCCWCAVHRHCYRAVHHRHRHGVMFWSVQNRRTCLNGMRSWKKMSKWVFGGTFDGCGQFGRPCITSENGQQSLKINSQPQLHTKDTQKFSVIFKWQIIWCVYILTADYLMCKIFNSYTVLGVIFCQATKHACVYLTRLNFECECFNVIIIVHVLFQQRESHVWHLDSYCFLLWYLNGHKIKRVICSYT